MLKRVWIRNFRTLRDLEWRPRALNVLVGPNNAGKTNLCYALRFLAASARFETVDDAAEVACGAATQVASAFALETEVQIEVEAEVPLLDGESGHFRYVLVLGAKEPRQSRGPILEVTVEFLVRTDMGSWPPLFSRTGDSVELFNEARWARGQRDDCMLTTSAPPRQTMLARLFEDTGNPSATAFKRFARNITYYRIDSGELRRPARVTEDPVLAWDGSNLGSSLYTMKNEDEGTYRELLGLLAEVEPGAEYFNFIRLADGTVVAEVQPRNARRAMAMSSMSDGSLRYLALAMVALQDRVRTPRDVEWPSVVMYEEPENGLYVQHLEKLVDRVTSLSERTQTILTTHNPFLLDYFDDRLDSIFVMTRGTEDTGTRMSSPDPHQMHEILEHMSMGEMLFRGVLTCA